VSDALEWAVRLADGAAEVLEGYAGRLRRGDADRKGAARDLVSEADLASERYLLETIPAGDDILSEEGASRDTGARRKWVIDPLDGTVNFLHGIPMWCVSVAAVEDGALAAGAIVAPALGERWTARAGGGCFLDGEPVRVSGTRTLAESVVATGFAYRRNELPDNNVDNFAEIVMATAGIRRMGAAALDLAFVASGRMDGFWELPLTPWDVAAAILMIREAGGRVTDFHGHDGLDDVLFRSHLVASNGHVHEALRGKLAPLRGLR